VFYVFIGLMFGMVIGWVIGFFDSNNRTSKKITAAESNAERKMKEAEQKIARASQSSQTLQDDPGLLRLKKNDGRFMLEMDGVPVTGELSPDKRKRLIELITVFRPWLEGGQPQQAVSQPAAPSQISSPQGTQLAPDSVQVAVPRPVQPSPKPAPPVKKPEAEKNIASLSIVQQIDTVLQARIADTPFAKRGIRLQESIQGGVEVFVGLQKFLAVDDVPDETVKAVIRAAIAEWEKKYTPGL
jgi:hypothetical protein